MFFIKIFEGKSGKKIFGLNEKQCLIYGMSRAENFLKQKNKLCKKIYKKTYNKVIFYVPTWRKKLAKQQPLMKLIKKNIKNFDDFLKKQNYLFLYSGHH